MYDILIVEDNNLVATLLRDYLIDSQMRVAGICYAAEEALEKIPQLEVRPQVILMDICLPGMSGIELTRLIKEKYPTIEIIIQSVMEDDDSIMDAIKFGATGYILKASCKEDIIEAIKEVMRGGSFLTGKIARKVLSYFKSLEERKENDHAEKFNLTEREAVVLDELVKGGAYKGIADKLSVSVHTVNNHIRHIYKKLQVNSKGEAVAIATGND